MIDAHIDRGVVGLFWVVEDRGHAVLLADAIPLTQAESYGDMLATEIRHYDDEREDDQ